MISIPEKEGEIYYIVSMDWFKAWKHYTGFNKVKLQNGNLCDTPNGDTDSTNATEDNMMSDDLAKLHVHKETPEGTI